MTSPSDPSQERSDEPLRTLPLFPLNTVVFPGAHVPLHVFEERYRRLVVELLAIDSPADRLFATTAIREGYEVGQGSVSLYRTGCIMQLTDVHANADGSYEIVATARERFHLIALEPGGPVPRAQVQPLAEVVEDVPPLTLELARSSFTGYRAAIGAWAGDPHPGPLPRDPVYLSWTLSALAPLPLTHSQRLLEAETATERLEWVTALLREEMRAINVIPSLPASHVPATAWSKN